MQSVMKWHFKEYHDDAVSEMKPSLGQQTELMELRDVLRSEGRGERGGSSCFNCLRSLADSLGLECV